MYITAYGHVGMICNGLPDALCMLIQVAVIILGKQAHAQIVVFCHYSSQYFEKLFDLRRSERCVTYQTVQLMMDTQDTQVTSVPHLYRIHQIFTIFHYLFFAGLHIQADCQDTLSRILCRELTCLGSPTVNESLPVYTRLFRRRIQVLCCGKMSQ